MEGALASYDDHTGSLPAAPHELHTARVGAIRGRILEFGAPAWGTDAPSRARLQTTELKAIETAEASRWGARRRCRPRPGGHPDSYGAARLDDAFACRPLGAVDRNSELTFDIVLTDWVGDRNSGQAFAIVPADRTDSDGDGGRL